jgi:Mg2+-importing ATPase
MIVLAFAIPYLPFAAVFGFVRLPTTLLVAIATIAALYVVATEFLKKWFYRKGGGSQARITAIRAAAA